MLVEEFAIQLSIRIPIIIAGSDVMDHLENAGQIEQAVRETGRVASESMCQKVVDGHNALQSFLSPDGYKFRQDYHKQIGIN